MSFKFLQVKRIEEKAELLEQSEFFEDLALDLQSMQFMAS